MTTSGPKALDARLPFIATTRSPIRQNVGFSRSPNRQGVWRELRLGDIGTFSKGKGIRRDQLLDEGLPCVLYGELYTRYDDYTSRFISKIPAEVATTARAVKTGDVLFTSSGETAEDIGRCTAYVGKQTAYAGGDILILTPRGHNSVFLGCLLNSAEVARQKARSGQGATVVHTNARSLAQVVIRIPLLAEQCAIAEVISDVDCLLRSLDALISKKRATQTALAQQLLTGQVRLPGFCDAWRTVKLGDIAHITTGSRNNQDKVADGKYPFFVRSAQVERINTFSFDGEGILIPGEGRIGDIVHYVRGRFDVHQRVYLIADFNHHVSGRFVYYAVSRSFSWHAMAHTVKATVDSLRLPTFKTFTFLIPKTTAEQGVITEILSDSEAEIDALVERRDKIRAVKQGMMQQLLTGRIRLVEPPVVRDDMTAT